MKTGAKKVAGTVTRKTRVEGPNKQTLLDEEEVTQMKPVKLLPGTAVAMITYEVPFKMSLGFNSVGVTIGVVMPWPVRPGYIEDLEKGYRRTELFVEKKVARRAKEIPDLLKNLAAKHRRR